MASPLKIGVLLSGSGTNLQALMDAIAVGACNAEIALVVSSRPDAYGVVRAQQAGIKTLVLNRQAYAVPFVADSSIAEALMAEGVEYVIMAGYMRKVTSALLDMFPNRVVNLHPALLPSFVGAHAIVDAWNAGVKVTGITVHFANEEYDKGPIIAQLAVPVLEDDTLDALEMRIHEAEHRLLPAVVQLIAEGRVSIGSDNKVHIR